MIGRRIFGWDFMSDEERRQDRNGTVYFWLVITALGVMNGLCLGDPFMVIAGFFGLVPSIILRIKLKKRGC